MAFNIQEWAAEQLARAARDGPPPERNREKEQLLKAIPGLREIDVDKFACYTRELSRGEHMLIRQYQMRRKAGRRQGEEFRRASEETR